MTKSTNEYELKQRIYKNQNLKADYLDDPLNENKDDEIVPSFHDLKRKTIRSLYGLDIHTNEEYNHALLMDKSPKGSLDEAIRPLVDLINTHPSFATLSSCSGRIALFDPNFSHSSTFPEDEINENESNLENINNSGKGRGGWLISSHAKITTMQLINALDQNRHMHMTNKNDGNQIKNEMKALIFKHEPLLLHVAASTLSRARQLQTIALNLGFRETGTVQTPKRITVAIRSHGLTLAVPMSSAGPLRPSEEYLNELVKEANERFDLNVKKLNLLEEAIVDTLFVSGGDGCSDGGGEQSVSLNSSSREEPGASLHATAVRHLPDLNLWGHAAVAISTNRESGDNNARTGGDVDLFVFGGHGTGPDLLIASDNNENSSTAVAKKHHAKTHNSLDEQLQNPGVRKCARSNKIFTLSRKEGKWDETWRMIPQDSVGETKEIVPLMLQGVECHGFQRTMFTATEGHSACVLPSLSSRHQGEKYDIIPMVAIFGGRASPARPTNELLFFQPSSSFAPLLVKKKAVFYKPIDTRGTAPSPRWAHSFTALSGCDGRLAIVVGGRNENCVHTSVHVLSCVPTVTGCSEFMTDSKNLVKATKNVLYHILWEELDLSSYRGEFLPRFHHCASLLSTYATSKDGEGGDSILVFGGMKSCCDLLESFEPSSNFTFNGRNGGNDKSCVFFRSTVIQLRKENGVTVMDLMKDIGISYFASESEKSNALANSFGSSSCSIFFEDYVRNISEKNINKVSPKYIIITGGLLLPRPHSESGSNDNNSSPLMCLTRSFSETSIHEEPSPSICPYFVNNVGIDLAEKKVDFGSLVHHTALQIPCVERAQETRFEIVTIGGGVQSFAFGSSFARSYNISLSLGRKKSIFDSINIAESMPMRGTKNVSSTAQQLSSKQMPSKDAKGSETDVLYVTNKHAKELKNALEKLSYLDKTYRMIKADSDVSPVQDPSKYIAVPITKQCVKHILSNSVLDASSPSMSWLSLVVASGKQKVPYSTVVLGKLKK